MDDGTKWALLVEKEIETLPMSSSFGGAIHSTDVESMMVALDEEDPKMHQASPVVLRLVPERMIDVPCGPQHGVIDEISP